MNRKCNGILSNTISGPRTGDQDENTRLASAPGIEKVCCGIEERNDLMCTENHPSVEKILNKRQGGLVPSGFIFTA
jgi:hypothetical protein